MAVAETADAASPESPAVPRLQLDGVDKRFDRISLALRDVDLTVAPGEWLTLLGPAGSGAATCLVLLAGFEAPSRGSIRLDGEPLDHLPPQARDIGVVMRDAALFPRLTVARNIAFPLRARGYARADVRARVRSMLARMRLASVGRRRPDQLTADERQRVALARALIFEPRLLLADDPFSALDPGPRAAAATQWRRWHDESGLTTLFATRDAGEALALSDRIAVFDDGAIVQTDTPATLYAQPASRRVAEILGGHNCLPARITRIEPDDGTCRLMLDGLEGVVIHCHANEAMAADEPATFALRPECIRLDPADDACDHVLDGTLCGCVFHGDHYRLRVALSEAVELEVRLANTPGQAVPCVDAAVRIGWMIADGRALDA